MNAVCRAITKRGEPCRTPAIHGSEYCFAHDPASADRRRKANAEGGRNSRTEIRAARRVPADLREVSDVILRAIRDVERGDLPPAQATAMASLARALVAVFEVGQAEGRMAELEAKIDRMIEANRTGAVA